MIELYPFEISDNIKCTGKTVAYCQLFDVEKELGDNTITKAALSNLGDGDRNRWDLFTLCSILATSSWNKNYDVFDPKQMFAARHSAKDKSFNYMHDQADIIGHITDNIAVDHNLQVIAEDTNPDFLPKKMHLITKSVLYRVWEDKAKQERMDKIIADIQQGKWFVSMECLFRSFSYILADTDGTQKVLARTADSSWLTKHLKQYGGSGKYLHYTIGRLLEDFTFSAVGLVNLPANPESIISNSLNIFDSANLSLGYITLDQLQKEHCMAETVLQIDVTESKEYKTLASKLDSATAKLEEISKANLDNLTRALAEKDDEFDKFKKKKADAEKDDEKEKEDMKAECSKKDKELEDTKATLETVKAELDAEKKTRQAYEEASRTKSRVEAFTKVGTDKAEATKLVEKFKDLSDVSFAAMIETVSNYASKAPKPVTSAARTVAATESVEDSPPLGSQAVNEFEVTRAQVKEFFGKKKGS